MSSAELPAQLSASSSTKTLQEKAVWTIVGSRKVRVVGHKHDAFDVLLQNSESVTGELNKNNTVAGTAVCDDNDSTGQGIVVHEEQVVLDKKRLSKRKLFSGW